MASRSEGSNLYRNTLILLVKEFIRGVPFKLSCASPMLLMSVQYVIGLESDIMERPLQFARQPMDRLRTMVLLGLTLHSGNLAGVNTGLVGIIVAGRETRSVSAFLATVYKAKGTLWLQIILEQLRKPCSGPKSRSVMSIY